MLKLNHFVFILLSLIIVSCKKDPKVEPEQVDTPSIPIPPTNTVTPTDTVKTKPYLVFDFAAMVNAKNLVTSTISYTNTSGDHFTITKFNYFISNVKLKRADGSVYSEVESYHLIKHLEGKTTFTINNLPEGNYTSIEFIIGVDAERNVSGAQSGDLDVSNDMFWDWDQGYIFFKLEGEYTTASIPAGSTYGIHIGGFSGKKSAIQQCSFSLTSPIVAKNNGYSKVVYHTIIDEVFDNPVKFGFDDYMAAVNDATFKMVSDNYRDMFVIEKIENH